jgi:uncharacterized protein YndB with AHSA1/START domain
MNTATQQTDRIEKQIQLKAPRARVWQALTDTDQFNEWFGVRLVGTFAQGAQLRGPVTHPGYEHVVMEITIERLEPQRFMSWRWHPGGDAAMAGDPETLVEFELDDVDNGTLLKVVETGFDRIPLARRSKAYRENEGGWTGQMKAIKQYVGDKT